MVVHLDSSECGLNVTTHITTDHVVSRVEVVLFEEVVKSRGGRGRSIVERVDEFSIRCIPDILGSSTT